MLNQGLDVTGRKRSNQKNYKAKNEVQSLTEFQIESNSLNQAIHSRMNLALMI